MSMITHAAQHLATEEAEPVVGFSNQPNSSQSRSAYSAHPSPWPLMKVLRCSRDSWSASTLM
ncbi:MAG: hypothetical protein R2713_20180 [Ilumatobacteraceae bacterium]